MEPMGSLVQSNGGVKDEHGLRKYRVYQVDAFTNQKFTGNPAGVVPNADGLSDEEMQRIARELIIRKLRLSFPLMVQTWRLRYIRESHMQSSSRFEMGIGNEKKDNRELWKRFDM